MTLLHWNYFLALEDDFDKLSRYIEIHKDNFGTYSIENARILMLATQEVDVLMKELCKKYRQPFKNEQDYRKCISTQYSKFIHISIDIPKYNLAITPFACWDKNLTPEWWTANNKIKHLRTTEFHKASLQNTICSMAALLLTVIYYYLKVENKKQLLPNPKLFHPMTLVKGITPTVIGNLNNYELL